MKTMRTLVLGLGLMTSLAHAGCFNNVNNPIELAERVDFSSCTYSELLTAKRNLNVVVDRNRPYIRSGEKWNVVLGMGSIGAAKATIALINQELEKR